MGVFDNSPTKQYVRLTGIIVKYNDNLYNVEDFYTMKKYIYWEYENPYVLSADNVLREKSFTRFLVMINDKGMNQPVENNVDNFTISYDGNSLENIRTEIIGIHDDVNGLGDKYTAVEIELGKIQTIVGELEETDGNIMEQITQIKQEADKIQLSLEKTQKEFANNTELVLLRERLNKAFIDFNASLGVAKGEFTNIFHDTVIEDEVEKPTIQTHIEILRNKEAKLYLELDSVISMLEAQGQTEDIIAVNSGKELLSNSMNNLVDITNTAISDGTITSTEQITIVNLFAKITFALDSLKNTIDDIVFLGSGGIITEWVGDITYTVNGVHETFIKTITNMKSQVSLLKAELQTQINDVLSKLKIYKDYITSAFEDGTVDESEIKAMESEWQDLEREKIDIDMQYDKYKDDMMIGDSTKLEMQKVYELYVEKHNTLKTEVDNAVQDGMVDDIDKLRVETAFTDYETAINNLKTTFDKGIEELDKNKYNEAIKQAQEETQKEIDDVKQSVSDLDDKMEGTFKDNVLDETERENIKRDMELINKEKTDVDNQYNLYYNNELLDGSIKVAYKQSYDDYIQRYNELKSLVDNILAKEELVTNEDKENLENAKKILFDKLNIFLNKSKEAVEYINNKQADKIKQEIGGEVGDVGSAIEDLRDEMNNSFKDGVLDEVEIKSLNERIQVIDKEKAEVDVIYEELYNNPDLI